MASAPVWVGAWWRALARSGMETLLVKRPKVVFLSHRRVCAAARISKEHPVCSSGAKQSGSERCQQKKRRQSPTGAKAQRLDHSYGVS